VSKIYIGNLNFQTTEDELRELLSNAGTVVDVVIPTDRFSGRPRGFAFAEFEDETQMAEAIRQFNDFEHRGRNLVVNEARERRRERPPMHEGSGGGGGGGGWGDDRRPSRSGGGGGGGSRRGSRDGGGGGGRRRAY